MSEWLVCILWGGAGFLWGFTIQRKKIEYLQMEIANHETIKAMVDDAMCPSPPIKGDAL